ncbi:MAG: hypothetical protein HYV15_02380, partial [Elusimicrobia bacterium]|nr:hypothetical protein [Elusimicrobiota bacterium]
MTASLILSAFLALRAGAEPLAQLEAEAGRLEGQVAAAKAREVGLIGRRLGAAAAGYRPSQDPGERAEAARAEERLRQALSREWIDSAEQDALMGRLRAETRGFEEAKEVWGGRDTPEARERLAAARLRVLQAQFAYFNAREAFAADRFEGFWGDLGAELADSYGEVASALVGKMVRQFADKLEKVSKATDKGGFLKALGELGGDLAADFTVELFSAGLKEAWVKGVIVDARVPRHFADELYGRFILPDREREKGLEEAFATGLAKGAFTRLADAQTQELQGELLKSLAPEELDVFKEVLTFDAMVKLAELSRDGRLDGPTLLRLFEQKLLKLDAAVLEKNWEKLQKLPAFKGRLASFGVYKTASDMLVQGAAFLENGWSGASEGALRRSVEDFRELAAFCARHPRLAVDPEQDSSRALVVDAVFTGAIQWREEAQAYERAVALEAAPGAATARTAEEAAAAWRAVIGVRPGKTWRPFLVVARGRLAHWQAFREKPGTSVRWRGEP